MAVHHQRVQMFPRLEANAREQLTDLHCSLPVPGESAHPTARVREHHNQRRGRQDLARDGRETRDTLLPTSALLPAPARIGRKQPLASYSGYTAKAVRHLDMKSALADRSRQPAEADQHNKRSRPASLRPLQEVSSPGPLRPTEPRADSRGRTGGSYYGAIQESQLVDRLVKVNGRSAVLGDASQEGQRKGAPVAQSEWPQVARQREGGIPCFAASSVPLRWYRTLGLPL